MADFHSLLSVFRDATAPPNSTKSNGPAAQRSTTLNGAMHLNDDTSINESQDVALTSKTDASYSASVVKNSIERLLRIHSIRKSTAPTTKPDANCNDRDSVHIAICATIVQEFPHEMLWKKWIDETGGNISIDPSTSDSGEKKSIKTSAELYIHAKKPEGVQSEWLKSKTLPITHRPDWNDVRIIRAMLSLLDAALKDVNTTHILLCTESCVPVVTLREAALSLLLDEPCLWEEDGDASSTKQKANGVHIGWDRSYVDCYDRNSSRCSRFDEHNCWGHLRDSIPAEAIYKALPGWCLLSRKHAQHILDLPNQLNNMNLWPAFEKVWAPEEVYFPTALNICGLMDEVVKRAVTHSEWDHKAVNLQDRAHPLCYDGQFSDELVCRVRGEGCLFLRKMKQSIDVEVWQNIVICHVKGHDHKRPADSRGGTKRGRDWEHGRSRNYDRDDRHYSRRSFDSSRRHGDDSRRYGSDRYRNDEPHWRR